MKKRNLPSATVSFLSASICCRFLLIEFLSSIWYSCSFSDSWLSNLKHSTSPLSRNHSNFKALCTSCKHSKQNSFSECPRNNHRIPMKKKEKKITSWSRSSDLSVSHWEYSCRREWYEWGSWGRRWAGFLSWLLPVECLLAPPAGQEQELQVCLGQQAGPPGGCPRIQMRTAVESSVLNS